MGEATVPVRIVDDAGTLLLHTEAMPTAMPTRGAARAIEDDVLQKILRGRELPRTGPTALPTLHVPEPEREPAPAPEPESEPQVTLLDAPDGPVDAPSGSALAAVDMLSLFGRSGPRGRHAR